MILGNPESIGSLIKNNVYALFKFPFPKGDIHHIPESFLLFTDIIGSSKKYIDNGDLLGISLANKQFEFANDLINTNYSKTVSIVKTIGDALMVISSSSEDIFNFILDLIKKIKNWNENVKSEEQKFFIRATINCGEFLIYKPPLSNRNDCFGEIINMTARLEGSNKEIIQKLSETNDSGFDFPVLITQKFYSHIGKKYNDTNSTIFIPQKTKIKEYNNKLFLVYLVNIREIN